MQLLVIYRYKGLEHVRKDLRCISVRYISHKRSPTHLAYEVIDNAIDEALAGYCDKITTPIKETERFRNYFINVEAFSGYSSHGKISALEVVMTQLNAEW